MLQTIRDRDYYSVVRDFFELSAISVRNTFDFTKRDEFEKRYLNVAKQYSKDQLETFASCLDKVICSKMKNSILTAKST